MKFSAKVGNEPMNNIRWRSGSPSGYGDCFLDLSILRDMETDINLLLILNRQMAGTGTVHTYAKARLTSTTNGGTGKTCLGIGRHCPSALVIIMKALC